jgi:periplasmic divalent cation tolerance protein
MAEASFSDEADRLLVALTTLPDEAVAARLARAWAEAGLAACVQIVPGMRSVYRWQGRLEEAAECQLWIKTTAGRLGALRQRLEADHPYDVPEFIVLPITDAAEPYRRWVVSQCQEISSC